MGPHIHKKMLRLESISFCDMNELKKDQQSQLGFFIPLAVLRLKIKKPSQKV